MARDGSFRDAAQSAVDTIAAVFDGWGPKVHKRIRSGSAANEIIKAAKQYDAGLVVVAAGGRGLSDSVLVGSTAQRVQHYAPCPVLVVRPAPQAAEAPAPLARVPPWRPCGWCCSSSTSSAYAALLGGLLVQARDADEDASTRRCATASAPRS